MKKLNAAGWMAVVIVTFAVVSVGFWAVRTIQMRTQEIGDLPTIAVTPRPPTETPSPTETPRPTDTPTPEVALDPTPKGWTMETDLFTGDNYLAPPPEDEAQIRAAFEAVLALVVIEDRSNEDALLFDRDAARVYAEELATQEIVEDVWRSTIFLSTFGPENPVHCDDYARCTVGRVKLEAASGGIVFSTEMCANLNEGIPPETQVGNFLVSDDGTYCVTRFVEDNPRVIYIATVDKQEDGVWRVVDFQTDPMK